MKVCLRRYFFIFVFQLVCLLSVFSNAKVVVFVPGYFNSLIPGHIDQKLKYNPYWSYNIINIYRKAGYKVFVVNNLNPVAKIETNGALLLKYLDSIQNEIDPDEGFSVIAHSSGGLYTIAANNIRPLPIRKMIAINTPFDGVDFIEKITKAYPCLVELEKRINLQSINQLRPSLVREFLSHLNAKPQFPIMGVAGGQERNIYNLLDAAYLTPIFYLTQALMDVPSDGVVTRRSAMAVPSHLVDVQESSEYILLDHFKQNLGAEYYQSLGLQNTDYIRKEQNRFYSRLLNYL